MFTLTEFIAENCSIKFNWNKSGVMKWSSNITIVQNLYSKTFYYKIIIFYLKKNIQLVITFSYLLTFYFIKQINFNSDMQVFNWFLSLLINLYLKTVQPSLIKTNEALWIGAVTTPLHCIWTMHCSKLYSNTFYYKKDYKCTVLEISKQGSSQKMLMTKPQIQ